MKTWVIFISIVVLLLATVPCSAFSKHSECNVEKNCKNDPHDCEHECNGKCSPFYSCGSCTGFPITHTSILISEKLEFTTNAILQPISYDKFVDSSFICKIWQPPKILNI
ncbi:hypothetical protein [Flavobacterium hydrocarbonoxydans]|uniref:hypothetical protein n=1 Tax=Flavobacterium hydrocarbonoxydans TaxID=2683249 RepID=UPI001365E0F7|nr:hypothetical protein [Flavobacterium hydrocarbonoxydans]